MPDVSEVKFDTPRCPGTTHSDISEFHHFIPVNKFFAGRFFALLPTLSSGFRNQVNLNIFIFEFYYFPFLHMAFHTIPIEFMIWKDLASSFCKNRNRIRIIVGISKDVSCFCCYPGILCQKQLRNK